MEDTVAIANLQPGLSWVPDAAQSSTPKWESAIQSVPSMRSPVHLEEVWGGSIRKE